MIELFTQSPFGNHWASQGLSEMKRGPWWEVVHGERIGNSVVQAITDLGLNMPLEEIYRDSDPMKARLADGIFDATIACLGAKMTPEMCGDLVRASGRLKPEIKYNQSLTNTANHDDTVAGWMTPVDTQRKPIPGGLRSIMNIPAFPSRPDGIPNSGDVSPILLKKQGDKFFLELEVSRGIIWAKEFIVKKVHESSNEIVGDFAGNPVTINDISPSCASDMHRMLFLTEDCGQDCSHCGYLRGIGRMTPDRRIQVSKTLDWLVANAKAVFGLGISSGSSNIDPDAGFEHNFKKTLDSLAQKLEGKGITANLELEFMLPTVREEWEPLIDKLIPYVRDLNWNLSLALNIEALLPDARKAFVRGQKGKSTLQDYTDFAAILKQKTEAASREAGKEIKIGISTLAMGGMRLIEGVKGYDMLEELNVIEKLHAAGIKVDLNPVKVQIGRDDFESFPPAYPVYYFIQDIALRLMHIRDEEKLSASFGCVGDCSLCHHKIASKGIITKALNEQSGSA